jgi:hypothetical protein
MVKVVEFIDSAIERLTGYGDNPRVLPALVHALYAPQPHNPFTQPGANRVNFKSLRHIPFGERKHKPHQMHSQFRESCAKVLSILVKRMDIRSRQCVYVNPVKKRTRTLYVPELARLTGLCDRTVTRALGALVRANYLFRDLKHRFFLSQSLFRDLNLSLTLARLTKQLMGLDQAKAKGLKSGAKPVKQKGRKSQCDLPVANPATTPAPAPLPRETSEASKSIGNRFLDSLPLALRRRRPSG